MTKDKQFRKTLYIAQLSILIALLIIMGFTSLGYIKIGIVEMTLNVIPVAIGAVVLGPAAGTILGAVFGLTSFIQCFGASTFGVALMNFSPWRCAFTCIIPRILTGLFTGLVFRLLSKTTSPKIVNCSISSLCCPIFNTILFVGSFIGLYLHSEYLQQMYGATGATNIVAFAAAFVGMNGVIEAVVCFVVASAASRVLLKINKRK